MLLPHCDFVKNWFQEHHRSTRIHKSSGAKSVTFYASAVYLADVELSLDFDVIRTNVWAPVAGATVVAADNYVYALKKAPEGLEPCYRETVVPREYLAHLSQRITGRARPGYGTIEEGTPMSTADNCSRLASTEDGALFSRGGDYGFFVPRVLSRAEAMARLNPTPVSMRPAPEQFKAFGLLVRNILAPECPAAVLTAGSAHLLVGSDSDVRRHDYNRSMHIALSINAALDASPTLPDPAVVKASVDLFRRTSMLRAVQELISKFSTSLDTERPNLGEAQQRLINALQESTTAAMVATKFNELSEGLQLPAGTNIPEHAMSVAARSLDSIRNKLRSQAATAEAEARNMVNSRAAEYYTAARAWVSNADDSRRVARMAETTLSAIRRAMEDTRVERVTVTNQDIHLFTTMMKVVDPRSKITHDVGRYEVTIPVTSKYEKIVVRNLSWTAAFQGPHVMGDDYLCLGASVAAVTKALSDGDLGAVIDLVLSFLQQTNVSDYAGKRVSQFPICRAEAERLGIPAGLWNHRLKARADTPYTMLPWMVDA